MPPRIVEKSVLIGKISTCESPWESSRKAQYHTSEIKSPWMEVALILLTNTTILLHTPSSKWSRNSTFKLLILQRWFEAGQLRTKMNATAMGSTGGSSSQKPTLWCWICGEGSCFCHHMMQWIGCCYPAHPAGDDPRTRSFQLASLHILQCGEAIAEVGHLERIFISCLYLSFLRKKVMVQCHDKLKGIAQANLERNRWRFERKEKIDLFRSGDEHSV